MANNDMKSVFEVLFSDNTGFQFALGKFGTKKQPVDPIYRAFFPDRRILKTSFNAVISDLNVVVSAAVTGFNTSAPLSGDESIQKQFIENLTILRGKRRTEKEIFEIEEALALGEDTIALQDFYDDVMFAWGAVILAKNAMVLQLLSNHTVTYTNTNNEGGASGVVLSYPITAAQQVDAGTSWDTSASAVPLTDIKGIVDTGRTNGQKYNYMFMERVTFDKMTACDSMKAAVLNIPLTRLKKGDFNTQILGLEDTNARLNSMDLPQIVIVDGNVRMEQAGGSRAIVNVWATDKVVFSETLQQGTFNYNIPLEEKNRAKYSKNAFVGNVDGVTIVQKYNSNPIEELTIGKAIGAPAFRNAASNMILDATP